MSALFVTFWVSTSSPRKKGGGGVVVVLSCMHGFGDRLGRGRGETHILVVSASPSNPSPVVWPNGWTAEGGCVVVVRVGFGVVQH